MTNGLFRSLIEMMLTRRSIFVSYHHALDQAYYDAFSHLFSDIYGIIRDHSLDRTLDTDDPEYVIRRSRERYISGSSCTIVLCGPQTPLRKYVDWEIKATLDAEHGLIGINLPHNPRNQFGRVVVPSRLHDNINSGYAVWLQWAAISTGDPLVFKGHVESAIARWAFLIRNNRPLRARNG